MLHCVTSAIHFTIKLSLQKSVQQKSLTAPALLSPSSQGQHCISPACNTFDKCAAFPSCHSTTPLLHLSQTPPFFSRLRKENIFPPHSHFGLSAVSFVNLPASYYSWTQSRLIISQFPAVYLHFTEAITYFCVFQEAK